MKNCDCIERKIILTLLLIGSALSPFFAILIAHGQGAITLTNGATGPQIVLPGNFSKAYQNIPYAKAIAFLNGHGAITCTITAGSLPTGLSVSGNVISGTPTGSGLSNFTVACQDANGLKAPALPTSISVATLNSGSLTSNPINPTLNAGATIQLVALSNWSDGTTGMVITPYVSIYTSSVTTCVTVNLTGLVTAAAVPSGCPSNLTYTFNAVTSATYSINAVSTGANPVVSTASPLPDCLINQLCSSVQMMASETGYSGSFTFTATGVPSGMTLSTSGVLSGTPGTAGPYTVAVTATDNASHSSAAKNLSLDVDAVTAVNSVNCTPSPILVNTNSQCSVVVQYAAGNQSAQTLTLENGGTSVTPTFVQSASTFNTTNTTSIAITLSSATSTTGSHIVLLSGRFNADSPTPTFSATDNGTGGSNSYSVILSLAATGDTFMDFELCGVQNDPATQLTISESGVSAGSSWDVSAREYSGSTCGTDGTNSSVAASGGTISTGNITITNTSDVISANTAIGSPNSTITVPSPWTAREDSGNNGFGGHGAAAAEDQLAPAIGTFNGSFTQSNAASSAWIGLIAAYKGISSGSGSGLVWSTSSCTTGGSSVGSINTAGVFLASATVTGTCVITATIGGQFNSFTITVNPNSGVDTSLILNCQSFLAIGQQSQCPTPTGNVTGNGYPAATFTSNNSSIVSISTGGLESGVAGGSATISAAVTSPNINGNETITVGTAQSLLSGCTVDSSNVPNCSTPAGWTLALADGFDSGALGNTNDEYLIPGENISSTLPHTGSNSLACSITGDGAGCQLGIFPLTVTSGSNHIYLSFWRYMGTNACGDTEIYFWDVYNDSRSTFFDVEDSQNYTSPLNTCVSSMQPAMIGDGSLNIFADVTGSSWNLPKGTWEQVEGEFQGSTCTGSTSNNDGLYRLYINGQLVAQHLNFNLNGCGTGASSTGMAIELGGIFTYLDANNNSFSPPPNGTFPVYLDDIIILKQ